MSSRSRSPSRSSSQSSFSSHQRPRLFFHVMTLLGRLQAPDLIRGQPEYGLQKALFVYFIQAIAEAMFEEDYRMKAILNFFKTPSESPSIADEQEDQGRSLQTAQDEDNYMSLWEARLRRIRKDTRDAKGPSKSDQLNPYRAGYERTGSSEDIAGPSRSRKLRSRLQDLFGASTPRSQGRGTQPGHPARSEHHPTLLQLLESLPPNPSQPNEQETRDSDDASARPGHDPSAREKARAKADEMLRELAQGRIARARAGDLAETAGPSPSTRHRHHRRLHHRERHDYLEQDHRTAPPFPFPFPARYSDSEDSLPRRPRARRGRYQPYCETEDDGEDSYGHVRRSGPERRSRY